MKKTINITALNPYIIHWATLIPAKGTVTKHDAILIDPLQRWHHLRGRKEISIHGATKESVLTKIKNIKGLEKRYKVYVYTDKQFGMRCPDCSVESILTTKQKTESFEI